MVTAPLETLVDVATTIFVLSTMVSMGLELSVEGCWRHSGSDDRW